MPTETRVLAIGACERRQALTTTSLEQLLADPDSAVRRRAVEVFARASPDEVGPLIETVVSMLDGDDAVTVELAAWALGETLTKSDTTEPPQGASVDISPVTDAIASVASSHPERTIRETAVAALGSIGDERGLDSVLRAMDDVATVRRRAVLSLGGFASDAAHKRIVEALEDVDWQVRQSARYLCRPPSDADWGEEWRDWGDFED